MDAFFATLAILVFVSGMAIFAFKKNDILELVRTVRQPQLSIQNVHSTILNGIQNINQLEVKKANFDSVAEFSDSRKYIPFSTRKLSIHYNGYVVLGCELDKIRISNSFFNRNHISIILPNSKILHVVPNMDSFKVYEDKGIFSKKIDFELQMNTVNASLNETKTRLKNEGYIEIANEEIRKRLNKLVESRGVVLEISFTDDIENLSPPDSIRLLQ